MIVSVCNKFEDGKLLKVFVGLPGIYIYNTKMIITIIGEKSLHPSAFVVPGHRFCIWSSWDISRQGDL